MAAKLKIDLSQGILEVEGSETFVKAIYTDFKAQFGAEEVEPEQLKSTNNRRRRSRVAKTTAELSPPPEPEPPTPALAEAKPDLEPVPKEAEVAIIGPTEPKSKAPVPKPDYTFLEELDLRPANGRPSLIEFMDAKFPITNEERNLVFLHYLQYTLNVKEITIDHIYTCYRAAKIRAPLNIGNSVQVTANQQHWIKINKNGYLSLTPAGKQYVEQNLPKRSKR
jgi:hypothetical protein